MKYKPLLALVLQMALTAFCGVRLSNETLIRLAPMRTTPIIDGKIDFQEWRQASTSYGGISPESGLMTRRENDFRFGYDEKYIYFAVTSEIPLLPQTLSEDDQVELQIAPPGSEKNIVLRFDFTGRGYCLRGVGLPVNCFPRH